MAQRVEQDSGGIISMKHIFCRLFLSICPCFDKKCSQIVDAQQIEIESLKKQLERLSNHG
jgi:hypothetical protein